MTYLLTYPPLSPFPAREGGKNSKIGHTPNFRNFPLGLTRLRGHGLTFVQAGGGAEGLRSTT